jgi:hypothetical protein
MHSALARLNNLVTLCLFAVFALLCANHLSAYHLTGEPLDVDTHVAAVKMFVFGFWALLLWCAVSRSVSRSPGCGIRFLIVRFSSLYGLAVPSFSWPAG